MHTRMLLAALLISIATYWQDYINSKLSSAVKTMGLLKCMAREEKIARLQTTPASRSSLTPDVFERCTQIPQ